MCVLHIFINERKTALLQPLRKSLSREGFVNKAILLINKMGLGVLNTRTDAQAKRMIREWVSKNISVKPRQMLQNMRFYQGIKHLQEVGETDDEDIDA